MDHGQHATPTPAAWAARFQQSADKRTQEQNVQVETAKQQMIDNVSRMSVSLRAAADSCDQFILAVTRANATMVATALSSNAASTSSVSDRDLLRRFAEANERIVGPGGSLSALSPPPSAQLQRYAQDGTPDETETNSKELSKRAKKLAKQAQDPDAPKRPPSAYLLFQNEVRPDMKNRYPDLAYKDVLSKIAEAWKQLTEAQRKVYMDKTTEQMERWAEEKREHERKTPRPSSDPRGADESVVSATLASDLPPAATATPVRASTSLAAETPSKSSKKRKEKEKEQEKDNKKVKDGEAKKKEKKSKKEKKEDS